MCQSIFEWVRHWPQLSASILSDANKVLYSESELFKVLQGSATVSHLKNVVFQVGPLLRIWEEISISSLTFECFDAVCYRGCYHDIADWWSDQNRGKSRWRGLVIESTAWKLFTFSIEDVSRHAVDTGIFAHSHAVWETSARQDTVMWVVAISLIIASASDARNMSHTCTWQFMYCPLCYFDCPYCELEYWDSLNHAACICTSQYDHLTSISQSDVNTGMSAWAFFLSLLNMSNLASSIYVHDRLMLHKNIACLSVDKMMPLFQFWNQCLCYCACLKVIAPKSGISLNKVEVTSPVHPTLSI